MTLPATDEHNGGHKFVRRYFDLQPVLVPICAIGLAFAIGSVVILAVGENPIEAYTELLKGMFGSKDRIAASLGRSTPYIGAALSVAFAFRAGLFNIGVEGQLLIGATVAAWVGTWSMIGDSPGIVIIPIVLLAGVAGGGLYGAIPGVLKARTGAHEVIVTIMLNSIAVFYVRWLVGSQDPVILRDMNASRPQTAPLPDAARLPELVSGGQPLHFGFFLMLGLCVLVWFVLQRTTTGFEVRMIGANAPAARYAGVRVNRVIVLVMVSAGALAGIAGASEVSGTTGFLLPGVFLAVGFDSIAIALLARANSFAIVPAAILWGSMLAGAPLMQQETGLSIDLVRIIQALVLLFVAADVIVRTIFRIRKREIELGPMAEAPVSAALGGTP
ncbi:MAG: ABC transporter permease [Actinomycetota bacterium]|nr:ABC transporter permease [Actinomycetota bacterium]